MQPYRPYEPPKRYVELVPDVKERGGCLSLYLGIGIIAGPIALFLFLSLASDPRVRFVVPSYYLPAQILVILTTLICTVAAWNWKLWGLRGLYVTMVLSNMLSIVSGVGDVGRNLLQLFIQPLILYLLTRNKIEDFE